MRSTPVISAHWPTVEASGEDSSDCRKLKEMAAIIHQVMSCLVSSSGW
jgi:hypothetical protein